MQTIKQRCRWAVMISICMLLMLVCSCAYADETVEVRVPVMATGADCSVELLDEKYQRVQWLDLQKDTPSMFSITCNGLKHFTFKAVILNRDDDQVRYDRTVYTIHADTYWGSQGKLTYIVSVENPGNPGSKAAMVTFNNVLLQPEVTPTPVPEVTATPVPEVTATPVPEVTATPEPEVTATPVPTPTPVPYDYMFTFSKRWVGGHEDSIDWAMYNPDGSRRHKLFNKYVLSEAEWYYEAYFSEPVDDCYVIESPMPGYMVLYENVGAYGDVTDRLYNGGTIVNYKVPQTSDDTPLAMYHGLIAAAVLGLCFAGVKLRKRWSGKHA